MGLHINPAELELKTFRKHYSESAARLSYEPFGPFLLKLPTEARETAST